MAFSAVALVSTTFPAVALIVVALAVIAPLTVAFVVVALLIVVSAAVSITVYRCSCGKSFYSIETKEKHQKNKTYIKTARHEAEQQALATAKRTYQ